MRKWLHGAASSRPPPAPPMEEGARARATSMHDAPASVSGSCGRQPIDDLGTDQPTQIVLKQYPASISSGRKHSFVSAWYHNRDWLKYSVMADAAFCFNCQQSRVSQRSRTLDTLVSVVFHNWREIGDFINMNLQRSISLAVHCGGSGRGVSVLERRLQNLSAQTNH